MVICLERGADLHMAQLMPLPLTVSCFSKIQIGFTFLVLAHPGSPGQRAAKRVCVCVFLCEKTCEKNVVWLLGGWPVVVCLYLVYMTSCVLSGGWCRRRRGRAAGCIVSQAVSFSRRPPRHDDSDASRGKQ